MVKYDKVKAINNIYHTNIQFIPFYLNCIEYILYTIEYRPSEHICNKHDGLGKFQIWVTRVMTNIN